MKALGFGSVFLITLCLVNLIAAQTDVLHTINFSADGLLVFQAHEETSANISLGGVPAELCHERCHLLLFLRFGSHGTEDVGKTFLASAYNSQKDLVKFFDMLNNYYPYNLGYELSFPTSAISAGGGNQAVLLSDKVITDIELSIGRLILIPSNYQGSDVLNVSMTLSFTVLGQAQPNLITTDATIVADTYVRNGSFNNNNYGTENILVADNNFSDPNFNRITYLQFTVPAYTAINKATLRLYSYNKTDTNVGVPIQIYGIQGAWTETSLTFANAPQPVIGDEATAFFYSFVGSEENWVDFDVTPWVRLQLPSGSGSISFAAVSFISGEVQFSSKEGPYPPQLSLYCVAAGATPAVAPSTNQPSAQTPTTTQQPTTVTPPVTGNQPSVTDIPAAFLQNSATINAVGFLGLASSLVFALF